MNIKLNAVAIVVLSVLSAGISNAYAGFNETPYVSYLSGDDFDVAFPAQEQAGVLKPSELRVAVLAADTREPATEIRKDQQSDCLAP